MDLIKHYLPVFQANWHEVKIPLESKNAAVIVEPRKDEYLELAIKNVVYYTPGWSLYVFHSKENEEFVKELLGADKLSQVHLICISKTNMSVPEYNTLLMMEMFWNWIDADNILIFQTDSYLRKFGIENFLNYDYIGAPWSHELKHYQAGNGGLSLRKKAKILQAIRSHKVNLGSGEDGYFQEALYKTGAKLPLRKDGMKFSVETIYYNDPIGVHAYWKYIKDKDGTLNKLEIRENKDEVKESK